MHTVIHFLLSINFSWLHCSLNYSFLPSRVSFFSFLPSYSTLFSFLHPFLSPPLSVWVHSLLFYDSHPASHILLRSKKKRKKKMFVLKLFLSLLCTTMCNKCECLPGDAGLKCAPLSPFLNDYLASPRSRMVGFCSITWPWGADSTLWWMELKPWLTKVFFTPDFQCISTCMWTDLLISVPALRQIDLSH